MLFFGILCNMCSSFKGHTEGGKSVQELVPAAAESSLVHRFVCLSENVSAISAQVRH